MPIWFDDCLEAGAQQSPHCSMVTYIRQTGCYSSLAGILLSQLHFPHCLTAFFRVLTKHDAIARTVVDDVIDVADCTEFQIVMERIVWCALAVSWPVLHANSLAEAKILGTRLRTTTTTTTRKSFVRMIAAVVHSLVGICCL